MTQISATPSLSNTRVIARNSIWCGAETGFVFVTSLFTSIAMARVLGPGKLGYFNYIMWLANMTGLIGSLGVPATTSKYMAEYLGRGEKGIARAVFSSTLRLQAIMAFVITGGALALVFGLVESQYRTVSAIQVASMLPAMLTFIPAQANAAREDLRSNALASIVGTTLYSIAVGLSLWLGWGLLGIAVGILIYRSTELVVRLVPVLGWISSLPHAMLPSDLKLRMLRFSGNSIVLMFLNVVVWDRSDIVLLKMFSSDLSQITFFTVAFNLVEKALIIPQTLATGVSVTINAQFGRDRSRLNAMVSSSARYVLLFSAPILLGLAAISSPAICIVYGGQYNPAIPVLVVAASLAVTKPLLGPARQMLQANEQQKVLVVCGLTCSVINVGIDWVLIPRYGALGAAIGNGVAQLLGVVGPWVIIARRFNLHLGYVRLAKIIAAASFMMAVVTSLHKIWPLVSLALAIPVGAVLFAGGIRVMRVLREEDVDKFLQVQKSVPSRVRPWYVGAVRLISGCSP